MDTFGERTSSQMRRLQDAARDFRRVAEKLDQVYRDRAHLDYSKYDGELTLETHLQHLMDGVARQREAVIAILNEPTEGEEAASKLLGHARA